MRILFTSLLPKLIDKMIEQGFQPAHGKDGLPHMTASLHYLGLAVDIDLYDAQGSYLSGTEDHKQFGEYWKSLHPACRWGGDFKNKDGNHYSVTYQGKA